MKKKGLAVDGDEVREGSGHVPLWSSCGVAKCSLPGSASFLLQGMKE